MQCDTCDILNYSPLPPPPPPPPHTHTHTHTGAPVVYLAPELPKRTYVLEAGHRARIQCLAESRTIPRPSSTASIERSSRQSFKRFVKRSILDSVHTFLSGGVVSESDAGEYECTVRNTANEAKRERFNVEVLCTSINTHTHTHARTHAHCTHTHTHTTHHSW